MENKEENYKGNNLNAEALKEETTVISQKIEKKEGKTFIYYIFYA